MKNFMDITMVFLFFTPFLMSGQNVVQGTTSMDRTDDIRFGAKAGMMVSDLWGKDIGASSPLFGFQVGGAVEIPLTHELHIAPELLVAFQGINLGDDNLRLNYLNLPLMGKYYITEEIAVELGPQIGILLGGNDDDFFLEANSIDVAMGAGGGYRLDDNFYFQLRFNIGLSKPIEDINARNMALQLGAIYYF